MNNKYCGTVAHEVTWRSGCAGGTGCVLVTGPPRSGFFVVVFYYLWWNQRVITPVIMTNSVTKPGSEDSQVFSGSGAREGYAP